MLPRQVVRFVRTGLQTDTRTHLQLWRDYDISRERQVIKQAPTWEPPLTNS